MERRNSREYVVEAIRDLHESIAYQQKKLKQAQDAIAEFSEDLEYWEAELAKLDAAQSKDSESVSSELIITEDTDKQELIGRTITKVNEFNENFIVDDGDEVYYKLVENLLKHLSKLNANWDSLKFATKFRDAFKNSVFKGTSSNKYKAAFDKLMIECGFKSIDLVGKTIDEAEDYIYEAFFENGAGNNDVIVRTTSNAYQFKWIDPDDDGEMYAIIPTFCFVGK